MRNLAALATLPVILTGCRAHYSVKPATPYYLLKSPDGRKRAFPDTLSDFGSAFDGWIDLGPAMALKLEKPYFVPPASRRLQDYLGLETVHYRYESTGLLRQSDYSPLENRPSGQLPVTSALPVDQLRSRHHRFFFQVVFDKESGAARAILLSGDSQITTASVADRLLRGDGCPDPGQTKVYCTAFPEPISASLSFEILANDKPLLVSWGSTVVHVVGDKRPVKLSRTFRGKRVAVTFDALDPKALRLPLWPGDVLTFGSR